MANRVVPQNVQKVIRADLLEAVGLGNDGVFGCSFRPTDHETLIASHYNDAGDVIGEYEVLFVVIPKQAAHHSEVRNG